MTSSTPFEIWAYRGIIALLLTIIAWWLVRYINGQDKINKQLFDLLAQYKETLTVITTKFEGNEKLCKLRHDGIEEQFATIEHKKK